MSMYQWSFRYITDSIIRVIKHYYILTLHAFKLYIFCFSELILNSDPLKHLDLFRRGDYVNVDVPKPEVTI